MAHLGKTLGLVALAFVIVGTTAFPALVATAALSTPRPAKDVPITLYGDGTTPTTGWGYGPSNITQPGPTITVQRGDIVRFRLFSEDSMDHILVVDTNGNGASDAGEASGQFSSPTQAALFNYTASTAGSFTYFCAIHGASVQRGTLVVQAPAGDNTLLIVGGIVAVVVIIGVAAVAMRRRKAKPPMQPPTQ